MDRAIFFAHVRLALFGGTLTQSQVEGISAILGEWERRKLTVTEQLAYMLATVFWETGRTMQPIREVGGSKARYAPYYGRGFVQLTWQANYAKAGKAVGVDLVALPDRALELGIATKILFDGMIDGWFTGKKLADYIRDAGHCDYVGARRIINGTDRAGTIAGYAISFEMAIEAAEQGQLPQPDALAVTLPPVEPPKPKPAPAGPAAAPVHVQGGVTAGAIAAVTASYAGLDWGWIAVATAVAAIAVGLFFLIRKGTAK